MHRSWPILGFHPGIYMDRIRIPKLPDRSFNPGLPEYGVGTLKTRSRSLAHQIGECSTHGTYDKYIQYFSSGFRREATAWETSVEESIIYKLMLNEKYMKVLDWIHLAQGRDQCRALVIQKLNLRFL